MNHRPLIERVHDALASHKPELAARMSAALRHSVNADDVRQQVELNEYLRVQLRKAPVSTLDERGCLIDDIPAGQWFSYFESHVLPTLVRFNLPSE